MSALPLPAPTFYTCPHCGAELIERVEFCPCCGAALKAGSATKTVAGTILLAISTVFFGVFNLCCALLTWSAFPAAPTQDFDVTKLVFSVLAFGVGFVRPRLA